MRALRRSRWHAHLVLEQSGSLRHADLLLEQSGFPGMLISCSGTAAAGGRADGDGGVVAAGARLGGFAAPTGR